MTSYNSQLAYNQLPTLPPQADKPLSLVTKEYIQQQLPQIYSRELVDLLFEQPYTRISNLEKAGIAKRHPNTSKSYVISAYCKN